MASGRDERGGRARARRERQTAQPAGASRSAMRGRSGRRGREMNVHAWGRGGHEPGEEAPGAGARAWDLALRRRARQPCGDLGGRARRRPARERRQTRLARTREPRGRFGAAAALSQVRDAAAPARSAGAGACRAVPLGGGAGAHGAGAAGAGRARTGSPGGRMAAPASARVRAELGADGPGRAARGGSGCSRGWRGGHENGRSRSARTVRPMRCQAAPGRRR